MRAVVEGFIGIDSLQMVKSTGAADGTASGGFRPSDFKLRM